MAPAPLSVPSTFTTSNESSKKLPAETRNAILAHLVATNKVTGLNTILRNELVRAGWTDRVKELSLELLRSGKCNTFEQVMGEVVRKAGGEWGWAKQTMANGHTSDEGDDDEGSRTDIKVPKEVVEQGVKYMKEALKGVVEVDHREMNGV
ncbi:MAG: hypothetical protein Q9227_009109 [Pyrenula ochraceoflavens]